MSSNKTRQFFLSVFGVVLFLSQGISAEALETTPLAPLIKTVAQRLSFADQVAIYKWNKGQPIEDRKREQQIIFNVLQQASNYHLDPKDVSQLFSDQIEANKLIQYILFSNWYSDTSTQVISVKDLNEIRARLDQLQITFLQQLEQSYPLRKQPGCAKILARTIEEYSNQNAIDVLHQIALKRALINICNK